jgi:hypothetical protein
MLKFSVVFNATPHPKKNVLLPLVSVILRCLCRLVLLLRYREKITRCPSMAPVQRKQVDEAIREQRAPGAEQFQQTSFTLSSGRVVRTISSAPPLHCRSWTAPSPPPLTAEEEERLGRQHTTAEVIKIACSSMTKYAAVLEINKICMRLCFKKKN